MYSQAHVSSHKGASVALRDRWWLKRRRREAEGPVFAMVVPCVLNRGWKGGRPWVRLKEEPKVHKRLLGRLRLSGNLLLLNYGRFRGRDRRALDSPIIFRINRHLR